MELVARLCHPVVVMHQGRTLCQGSFAEVARNPLVLEAYLGGRAA
jgi:ABC-type branched-subunit amino acid transport system ATPase component